MSQVSGAPRPRVFAPQIPSRIDASTRLWVPTINIRPATEHGSLIEMLPPNANRMHMRPLVDAMKSCMEHFCSCDFLIAVGDPALIAAAAVIAHGKVGTFNILKWDRMQATYIPVEISV